MLKIKQLRTEHFLIFIFILIKRALHLTADAHSGFQGDEFLHIESGNHPDFGYMEFPPMIGWMAFLQNLTSSNSVFAHHIFAHIAAAFILIVGVLIVLRLGGRSMAVFIFLLSLLVAPAFGRSQQLFQPVVFSQLFWLFGYYQLIKFIQTKDKKYFLYLTIVVAFGFLTKYDIVFFIAGLFALIFFKRTRVPVFTKALWKYGFIFLLLISPNLWWQYQHNFPVLMHFSELYASDLNSISWDSFLINLFVSLNPFTAIIWIAGFIFMFNRADKEKYRPLAAAIVLSVSFLILARGKFYYFFPMMIMALALGSIWFENNVLTKGKWLLYPLVAFFLLSGIVMVPHSLSLLPLNDFIKFARIEKENNRYKIPFEEYYSQTLWQDVMSAIKRAYDGLPENEKQNYLIWGKHYKDAGAVNLYRSDYQLPKAFSYHGSFYLWAHTGNMPHTIIAFSDKGSGIDFWQTYFQKVIEKERIYNPYADDDEDLWRTIYICQNPKQDFNDLKKLFKNRIFE